MFQRFNTQYYFAGRLPDYRILLVYDVWHRATEQCGYEPVFRRPQSLAASSISRLTRVGLW
jgi:hypothetical protein